MKEELGSVLWYELMFYAKCVLAGLIIGQVYVLTVNGSETEARIQALEAATCEQHPEPAAPVTCACAGETP